MKRWKERRRFIRKNKGSFTRSIWNEYLAANATRWDDQKRREVRAKEKLREKMQREKDARESFYEAEDEHIASNTHKGKELKVIVKVIFLQIFPSSDY